MKGVCDEDSDDPLDRIVSIDGFRIYMTHGHRMNIDDTEGSLHTLCGAAKRNKVNIVAFGHTHIPLIEIRDDVLLLNPGSLAINAMGKPPSYMALELHTGLPAGAEVHFVNKNRR